jgi:hypothetical protein
MARRDPASGRLAAARLGEATKIVDFPPRDSDLQKLFLGGQERCTVLQTNSYVKYVWDPR